LWLLTTSLASFAKNTDLIAILELCTITSLVVYGTPDAEIRKRLDPFGAVYMTPFDGFSR
jgi:hypothetical protein